MKQGQTGLGDMNALLGTLRRRLPLIVVAVVIALGAAYALAKSEQKKYTATASLLFKPLLLDMQLTGLPLSTQASDPATEAATDIGLVTLPQIRNAAAQTLGHGYTANYLLHNVNVSQQGKSQIVDVKASATTPQAAAAIANAMARSFIAYEGAQIISSINSGISRVNRDLHGSGQTSLQRSALMASLTKLTELKAVEPDNVQLAGVALPPTTPSSPRTSVDLAIGGIAGLVLGLAFALVAEQRDVRIRRPEQVEDAVDLPVLAMIPRSRALSKGAGLTSDDLEAFRLLRTNLRYPAGGREMRSVLLTSATPGSGKTTVALHLAAAAAAVMPGRVLLIEADMRRPHLGKLLGIDSEQGLSTALHSGQELQDVVVTVPGGHWNGSTNGNGSGNGSAPDANGGFDVLVGGPPSPHAAELLSSDAAKRLLGIAASSYALTIIEGPPPGLVSDVVPLLHQVDGVLLVARLGREHSPELKALRTQLERLGVRPLGVVANFSRRTSNPYLATRE